MFSQRFDWWMFSQRFDWWMVSEIWVMNELTGIWPMDVSPRFYWWSQRFDWWMVSDILLIWLMDGLTDIWLINDGLAHIFLIKVSQRFDWRMVSQKFDWRMILARFNMYKHFVINVDWCMQWPTSQTHLPELERVVPGPGDEKALLAAHGPHPALHTKIRPSVPLTVLRTLSPFDLLFRYVR